MRLLEIDLKDRRMTMNYASLKAAGYVLVHTPDMIMANGSTQTTERLVNPDSEYLKKVPEHIRSYEEVVNYAPNQVYIGNMTPDELSELEFPWYDKPVEGKRHGRFGEILPEKEFYGLLEIADVFELVFLEESFAEEVKAALKDNELFKEDADSIKQVDTIENIEKHIDEFEAEPLYYEDKLVGCVHRAHEYDVNLNAHTMLENLVVKASGILSLRHLLADSDINPEDVDYVIECSEEACGDINQRGGGNFAKSIAEKCGCANASGSDVRGFCAAPTHALVSAASMVAAGTHKNVVVVAGGSTAKLGMNGKSHVEKDMPILEDVVGGFAVLVGENDGKSPILHTDLIGKHTVSSGSSPQKVMTALVGDALDHAGLSVNDIDVYSSEMQNPDITVPAGAGNVPEANVKMIGALGVMRKELERSELPNFLKEKGIPGWAPTQGHIPSGVPYLGFAIEDLTSGDKNRAMIIGKGSLFLGRMTNLFDGLSVIVERNSGEVEEAKNTDFKEAVKSELANALRDFAANLSEE